MSRRTAAGLALVAVGGPALGLAAWWLLRLASVAASPAYLVGAAVAGLAVVRLVRTAAASALPPPSLADGDEEAPPRALTDLVTLEHRLAWGGVDAERFDSRVRPLLAGLVAERLRQRHGVDVARDPDRARSILGEDLWTLMSPPARPTAPSPQELGRLVTLIERL
jgi:hypothetical protein